MSRQTRSKVGRQESRDNLTDIMNMDRACRNPLCHHKGKEHTRTINDIGGTCKVEGCLCEMYKTYESD